MGASQGHGRTPSEPPTFLIEAAIGFSHFCRFLEVKAPIQQHRGQSDAVFPLLIPFLPPSLVTLAQTAGDSSANSSSSLWFPK